MHMRTRTSSSAAAIAAAGEPAGRRRVPQGSSHPSSGDGSARHRARSEGELTHALVQAAAEHAITAPRGDQPPVLPTPGDTARASRRFVRMLSSLVETNHCLLNGLGVGHPARGLLFCC